MCFYELIVSIITTALCVLPGKWPRMQGIHELLQRQGTKGTASTGMAEADGKAMKRPRHVIAETAQSTFLCMLLVTGPRGQRFVFEFAQVLGRVGLRLNQTENF